MTTWNLTKQMMFSGDKHESKNFTLFDAVTGEPVRECRLTLRTSKADKNNPSLHCYVTFAKDGVPTGRRVQITFGLVATKGGPCRFLQRFYFYAQDQKSWGGRLCSCKQLAADNNADPTTELMLVAYVGCVPMHNLELSPFLAATQSSRDFNAISRILCADGNVHVSEFRQMLRYRQ